MIKIFGLTLLVIGAIALIIGVMGIFGSLSIGISPWGVAILGLIFFTSSVGLLKRKRDTDEV